MGISLRGKSDTDRAEDNGQIEEFTILWRTSSSSMLSKLDML